MRSMSLDNKKYKKNHNFFQYKIIKNHEYQHTHTNQLLIRDEATNPIYGHMKNQKIIQRFFEKMYHDDPKEKMKSQKSSIRILSKSRVKTEPIANSKSLPITCSQSYNLKRQSTGSSIEKIKNFTQEVTLFHDNFSKSKERLNILHRFSKVARAYEKRIPDDPERTMQSEDEDETLLKVCKEDSIPMDKEQNLNEQAEKMKKYKEPKITQQLKSKYLRRKQKKKPTIGLIMNKKQ